MIRTNQQERAGMQHWRLALLMAAAGCAGAANSALVKGAEQPRADYELKDPALKAVLIDSSPTESFLAMRADSAGRLFVGAREALFVYEPLAGGLYGKRQELYRFPPDSWVYDVEIRGNDVYAMTNRALYLLPGAVQQRTGLQAKRILWGHPDFHPHQCLHGMAWGPDGDLYLTIGDLLVWYGDFNRPDHWGHWTFRSGPDGQATPFTGVGSVLRCRPDGSDLRVIAGGLRNSCGLVFDRWWNLFTHDNDHEGLPTDFSPGRLLHVTPYAAFGWPRGWMPSLSPDRADLLPSMFTGMGRAVPVGQTYYHETYLPEKYQDNLLLARWGNRTISRYPLRRRGATFAADEHVLLEGFDQTRPVGVAVGRGGRIFATLAYMTHNEGSPTYKSDLIMITRQEDPSHHPFDAYEAASVEEVRLWNELVDASSWRSRRAMVELLRRGKGTRRLALAESALNRLSANWKEDQTDPPAAHFIWLTAALCDESPMASKAIAVLTSLVDSANARLRFQALRALTEFYGDLDATSALAASCLDDDDPSVQHAAAVGLLDAAAKVPITAKAAARSADPYVRQATAPACWLTKMQESV